MSVAAKFLFPPVRIPDARHTTRTSFINPSFLGFTESIYRGRAFPLPSVASVPYQPINVDYLEEEFNGHGHGVTFEAIGDECIAKLELENGTSSILMLPSGLLTSYKPLMWHGGSLELLHSSVSEEKNGDVVIQGGVSLDINCHSNGGHDVSCSSRNWTLHQISGNPSESIQVELIDSESNGMVQLKYVVTLREYMLTSELIVSNNKQTSLNMTASVLSHLTVSTPEATFAVGLERSNFYSTAPFSSSSAIIPPDYGQVSSSGWDQTFKKILPGWGKNKINQSNAADESVSSQGDSEDMEGEETDNYKQLTEQMSRIYTTAPRNFTIIDRGRRNSVVVGREGFDELYMFSPGSNHVYYGEYSYICVGQSAILNPIVVGPGQVWRGSQHLLNPNL